MKNGSAKCKIRKPNLLLLQVLYASNAIIEYITSIKRFHDPFVIINTRDKCLFMITKSKDRENVLLYF